MKTRKINLNRLLLTLTDAQLVILSIELDDGDKHVQEVIHEITKGWSEDRREAAIKSIDPFFDNI